MSHKRLLQSQRERGKKNGMLIVDPYSLLPAFTLASFLIILLWPENISFRNRLRLFIVLLLIWTGASIFAFKGYGANEMPFICLINMAIGLLGLIAIGFTLQTKPSRTNHPPENPPN